MTEEDTSVPPSVTTGSYDHTHLSSQDADRPCSPDAPRRSARIERARSQTPSGSSARSQSRSASTTGTTSPIKRRKARFCKRSKSPKSAEFVSSDVEEEIDSEYRKELEVVTKRADETEMRDLQDFAGRLTITPVETGQSAQSRYETPPESAI